jgi:hypothetical protein
VKPPDFLTEISIQPLVRLLIFLMQMADGSKESGPADQSSWGVGSLVHLDIYNRLRPLMKSGSRTFCTRINIAKNRRLLV